MLSRRDVLATTAGLAIASQTSGPAGAQPARRIIVDAQVHIWKASTPERPWTPGLRPQLPEPFGYERLHTMMNEASVARKTAT